MTFLSRLKSSASTLGRTAAGVALGLGLAASLLGAPAAWAQDAAPAATPRAPAGSGPALWVIKDEDSTIYLFGTVHVLQPSTAWASDRVDAAFASADTVYFEITNPDDQAAALPLIQQYGMSPDRPLSSLLTAAELEKLDAAAQEIGASAAMFEPFRPWLAGLTLSMAPLVKAGYDPNSGVELVLRAQAQAAGKPIMGLETLEQQIQILAGFPEEGQLAFLRETLDAVEDASTDLDALVAAWSTGDVAAIERLGVDKTRETSEAVYDALLARRNADWAGQIETMLEGSGTVFIAVGAAHLAGEDSVQAVLARDGVTAQRVQ